MLSKERMVRIMNELNENSFVSVKDLMELLQTSRSSVMRDLIELENQGLIQRERGGASLKGASMTLTSFNEPAVKEKEHIHEEQKRKICQMATKSIQDGDCVYIDSGTTPVYLLEYLGNKKIKLVTPSTYLIRKLPMSFQGDIYLLGGEFNTSYDMSYGSLTLDMIRQFTFDHAFYSTNGVNLDTGEVCVFDFQVGAIKKEILQRSKRNDLLVDSSKFTMQVMCTWSTLDQFHTIYTDAFPKEKGVLDNVVICE